MSSRFRTFLHYLTLAVLSSVIIPLEAAEPVRVIATGGRMANTFHAPATGNTAFRQRTPHKLGGAVAEMQIGFMDWMYPYDNETPNTTNDVTIEHAWLERATTGQIVPLTFSGSRQLVLPMNSTTAYWLSDAVPSTTWTGAAPARDEVFWLHVRGFIPDIVGAKIPTGTPTTYSGAKLIVYPPANDPGTFDTGGTVPIIPGSVARSSGLPLVFLGRFAGPGNLSVIGIGDSILDGTGDPSNPVPVISGYGFFNRAALDSSGANTIAMFNLTRHGQAAANFIKTSQTRQPQFLRFANVVVEEYGTNDLAQAGSGDPTTILNRVKTIWSMARNAGVQKIVRTKLLPRTTSTDSWSTLANQTTNTGWGDAAAGNTGKRDLINAGFATALSTGEIDVLVDTLTPVCDTADDHYWLTNGNSKYTTSDGTHVSPAGNILLTAPLRSALLSLTVDPPEETTYLDWSDSIDWNGGDSSALADPNHDGVNNLLCYAFNLSPLAPAPADKRPSFESEPIAADTWLSYSYRERGDSSDIFYQILGGPDLSSWDVVEPDGSTVIREILDPNPDGDGSTILVRIRINTVSHPSIQFLRLQVSQ